jgi:hypothetical protein
MVTIVRAHMEKLASQLERKIPRHCNAKGLIITDKRCEYRMRMMLFSSYIAGRMATQMLLNILER